MAPWRHLSSFSTAVIVAALLVTIPAAALRVAGLEVGERLVAHVEGPGRVVFEREADALAEFAGVLTGVFEPDELAGLRDEWD